MPLMLHLLLFGLKLGVDQIFYFSYGQFGSAHAFGYNSARSEPIWMKSGALWVHCWGLALADFGCNPHSSESLRGRQNFFVL